MRSILLCLGHRRPRTSAPLRPLNARAKSFVVGIEVEKKIFAVSLVIRLILLQYRFEKPRRMPDVPARRRHELGGLDYVIFDFQRRNDFESASADGLVEIGDRSRF